MFRTSTATILMTNPAIIIANQGAWREGLLQKIIWLFLGPCGMAKNLTPSRRNYLNSLGKNLESSIGKKWIVGLTGLGLVLFVISHLGGNLLLYLGMGQYNEYAHALHSREFLLHIAEVGLLIFFVVHIFTAIQVSRENCKARPVGYAVRRSKQGRTRFTSSAVMLFTGTIVLGFVLLHLADLRFNLRHQVGPEIEPATHTLLVLQDPISGGVYFLGSLFLGYHLWHAIQSVFQTYGLNHHRYTPWIKKIGMLFAIILGLGFASFPVWGLLIKLGVIS
jgi:succinate dehydrogenase / fumarate reductase cytochrome b subunit